PEPAEKIAGAEMQQMVGDDAAEALSGIEPFAGAVNQAAPDPVAIDFSRVRLEPLVGGSGITLLVNLSSRRHQFVGNLRAGLGPAGERLPLECEMGRFSWRGIGGSVILHAAIVSVLMVLPAIPRAMPVIVEEKHTDYIPIYRAVESKRRVQVLRAV